MEEKLLPTPRGDIHYWVSRGGDPQAPGLVFCHGLMADHSMWEPQVKAFAGRRTLIAWDAPLHGASRPYRDFDYRRAGEDLLAILDAEALARAVFVGADLGAPRRCGPPARPGWSASARCRSARSCTHTAICSGCGIWGPRCPACRNTCCAPLSCGGPVPANRRPAG